MWGRRVVIRRRRVASLRPRHAAQLVSAGADAAGASSGVCSELVSALVPMQFVELQHRMGCSGLVSAQVPMQSVERMQLTAGEGGSMPRVVEVIC